MARLTRVHQKVFASNASNNGVFGSLQAGNPQTSNDVATLQSLNAFENGWDDAIEQGDKLPPLEEFQGIQYGISYQQAYILQEGIPEWNTNTAYYKGSLVKTISGTSFKIFSSLTDNNTGNLTTNTTHWKLAYDSDIGYADSNFSNLLSPAKNIANWSNNVTNCITEIPQDIKLELNNGTLTLKAGSKVYVPNGSGTFNAITISNDISSSSSWTTGNVMLAVNQNYNGLYSFVLGNQYSGTTAPSNPNAGTIWYDTTNNLIKRYSGTVWESGVSFPICITNMVSGTGFSSIDQVFNGFGYIGSVIFALPGVKGLFCNGRNTDGTLSSVSFEISSVSIANNFNNNSQNYIIIDRSLNVNRSGVTITKYDEKINYIVRSDNQFRNGIIAGIANCSSTGITSFSTKTAFNSVDYYDFKTADDNNVKLTGNQSLSGVKTNSSSYKIKSPYEIPFIGSFDGVTKGTAPASNRNLGVCVNDGQGDAFENRLGNFYVSLYNTNKTRAAMTAYKPASGSTSGASIYIEYPDTGNPITYAPTPPTGDSSTQIATTAWVAGHRCTTAATTTSTASVNAPAYVVENYKNGSDWYRVWSDGWIEQGGASPTFSASNTDTTVTVNLLKPFTDTNYSVLALSDDCGYRPALTYSNKTTSSFKLRRESHSGSIRSGIADWRACGY